MMDKQTFTPHSPEIQAAAIEYRAKNAHSRQKPLKDKQIYVGPKANGRDLAWLLANDLAENMQSAALLLEAAQCHLQVGHFSGVVMTIEKFLDYGRAIAKTKIDLDAALHPEKKATPPPK